MEDIGREGCECRSDHRAAWGIRRLRWLGQRRGAALPSELEQKSSKREFWLLRVVVGREGFALFATLAGLARGDAAGEGTDGKIAEEQISLPCRHLPPGVGETSRPARQVVCAGVASSSVPS